MNPSFSICFCAGALLVVVFLPFWMRKVPMNQAFGAKWPQAYRSDKDWYDINAYCGRLSVLSGCILMVIGCVGFLCHARSETYDMLAIVLTGGIPIVAFFQMNRWVNRRDRQPTESVQPTPTRNDAGGRG